MKPGEREAEYISRTEFAGRKKSEAWISRLVYSQSDLRQRKGIIWTHRRS